MKFLTRKAVVSYSRRRMLWPLVALLWFPLAIGLGGGGAAAGSAIGEAAGASNVVGLVMLGMFAGGLVAMACWMWILRRLTACPSCGAAQFPASGQKKTEVCGRCNAPLTLAAFAVQEQAREREGGSRPMSPALDPSATRAPSTAVLAYANRIRKARRLSLVVVVLGLITAAVIVAAYEAAGGRNPVLLPVSFAPAMLANLGVLYYVWRGGACPHCGSRKGLIHAIQPHVRMDVCPNCNGTLRPEADAPTFQSSQDAPYGRK